MQKSISFRNRYIKSKWFELHRDNWFRNRWSKPLFGLRCRKNQYRSAYIRYCIL